MNQALEKRSPLKSAPLRNPGQSLDEEIDRLLMDKAAPYLYGTTTFLVIAGMEWWHWYLSSPPHPLLFTAIMLIAMLVTAPKLVVIRRQIRHLKLVRDGERAVGQYLEQLREQGYRVLHDLVGDGFNPTSATRS